MTGTSSVRLSMDARGRGVLIAIFFSAAGSVTPARISSKPDTIFQEPLDVLITCIPSRRELASSRGRERVIVIAGDQQTPSLAVKPRKVNVTRRASRVQRSDSLRVTAIRSTPKSVRSPTTARATAAGKRRLCMEAVSAGSCSRRMRCEYT